MAARPIPRVLRPGKVAAIAAIAIEHVRCGLAASDAAMMATAGERLTANETAAIAARVDVAIEREHAAG